MTTYEEFLEMTVEQREKLFEDTCTKLDALADELGNPELKAIVRISQIAWKEQAWTS